MTASAIREMLKITQQPDVISFAGGLPAPELFPIEDVRRISDVVLSEQGATALQYSTTEGYLPLREWLATREQIAVQNVQIVTGSQQGLDLLGKILINPGDHVLLEAPTYMGALQSFHPYAPQYIEVPTDEDGICLDALEDILKHQKVKFLYCVPSFQNPTGRTLVEDRRRRLVELTAEHNVLIIEDDPYSSLRFRGESLPSLYTIGLEIFGAENNNVIYCSSFSKTLAPGLRTAWIQGATPIIQKVSQAKQGADLHTPTINQMVVYELLDILPRQIEIVRQVYGERADHMLSCLAEQFPQEIQYTTPEGGMFIWVTLPQGMNTQEMFTKAVARKVAYVPGRPFFAKGGGENTLRLSFSSVNPQQISTGISALAQTIRKEME